MRIKPITIAIGAAALITLLAPTADASERHGVVTISVPANADVVVSYPFNQEPVGEYEVSGLSGATLTLSGTPGLTSNELEDTHYVRVIDGPAAGLWSTISANSASQLTLADSAVANLMTGDETIRVYPHHTIGSVFPDEDKGLSFVDGTQVQFFANETVAQNLAFGGSDVVEFSEGGFFPGWSDPERIIPPDTAFVIRNNSNAALTFIAKGRVPNHKVSYLVPDSVNKDTAVGSGYPVPSRVKFSGFGGVDARQIQLYANDAGSQNLAVGGASVVEFSEGGFFPGWSDADLLLPPGEGYVLRQNGGAGGLIETAPVYPVATD